MAPKISTGPALQADRMCACSTKAKIHISSWRYQLTVVSARKPDFSAAGIYLFTCTLFAVRFTDLRTGLGQVGEESRAVTSDNCLRLHCQTETSMIGSKRRAAAESRVHPSISKSALRVACHRTFPVSTWRTSKFLVMFGQRAGRRDTQ